MKVHYWILIFMTIIGSSCNKDSEQLLKVNYEIIASGFTIPWSIAVINEDEFLFTERLGELFLYKNGEVKPVEYLPVTKAVGTKISI